MKWRKMINQVWQLYNHFEANQIVPFTICTHIHSTKASMHTLTEKYTHKHIAHTRVNKKFTSKHDCIHIHNCIHTYEKTRHPSIYPHTQTCMSMRVLVGLKNILATVEERTDFLEAASLRTMADNALHVCNHTLKLLEKICILCSPIKIWWVTTFPYFKCP